MNLNFWRGRWTKFLWTSRQRRSRGQLWTTIPVSRFCLVILGLQILNMYSKDRKYKNYSLMDEKIGREEICLCVRQENLCNENSRSHVNNVRKTSMQWINFQEWWKSVWGSLFNSSSYNDTTTSFFKKSLSFMGSYALQMPGQHASEG